MIIKEYCFSMWYLMYGRHTFSLHVYIQIPSSQSSREMVFKASGSASKTATHWLFTQATIRRPRDWEQGRMANITVAGIRGLRKVYKIIKVCDVKKIPRTNFRELVKDF